MNRELAEHFGIMWHEITQSADDSWICSCGVFGEVKTGPINHKRLRPNPDFTELVEVKCKECGGSGTVYKDVGRGKTLEEDCPCQGKPHKISLLQKMAEEKGTWEGFIEQVERKYTFKGLELDEIIDVKKVANILTDTNKQCGEYLKWIKEGA
jgi:hypothetical protein